MSKAGSSYHQLDVQVKSLECISVFKIVPVTWGEFLPVCQVTPANQQHFPCLTGTWQRSTCQNLRCVQPQHMLVKEGPETITYKQGKGPGLKSGWRHKSRIIYIFQLPSVTSVPTLTKWLQGWRMRAVYFLTGLGHNWETTRLDFTSLSCAFGKGSSSRAFVHSRLSYQFRIHWGTMNREPSDNIFIVSLLTMGACNSQGNSCLCLIRVLISPPVLL